MTIVPIKELKDGAAISQKCHELGEPIYITKNGYADMVIMSAEAFEEYEALARNHRIATAIREGIEEYRSGEYENVDDVIAQLRRDYGL